MCEQCCEESSALTTSPVSLTAEEPSEVPVTSQTNSPSNTPALAESWSPNVSVVAKCELMQMGAADTCVVIMLCQVSF